jgi:hypothetical protein
MAEISDEELFNNALTDEPNEPVADETAGETSERARDAQGRFAEKTEENEVKPEPKPAETEAQIPSWRLREIREERDQLRAMLTQLQAQPKPTTQPQAKPDLFEKPDEFVRQGAQELVDPVKAEISALREEYSRMHAIDKHGEEKVGQAYAALDQAAKAGDPEAVAIVGRVKQSMTPFQEIMRWHEKQSVFSQIGNDPEAWFQKQLETKIADEKFKGELLAKLQPQSREKPKPVFNVPPSLSRTASATAAFEESGDLSDESLFAHAMR